MIRPPDINVVLTGFMGTGKSTVGRLISRELGWAFVDTDELIEAEHGPIVQIFAERHEAAFRELEREYAAKVASKQHQVIATGGRMMLDAVNAEVLQATGRVFCLTADAEEIVSRLRPDLQIQQRPLVAGADDVAVEVMRLLDERAAGYGRFEQMPTDGRTPEDIAADIIGRLSDAPPTVQR